MAVLLGEKGRFAAEVGDGTSGLRRVDLWAADQWLTCDDNMVFVEQFRHAVQQTAASVRSGRIPPLPSVGLSPVDTHRRFATATDDDPICQVREQFWFLHWGPTTDNVQAFAFLDADHLVITWQFWREAHLRNHPDHAGRVFEMKIECAQFAEILEGLISAL
ncbi:hypothetical protein ACFWU5_23730 [Nocardia sp. NPDC058640]|uniref:hypothetical protein n=1 Tax=Nocardia sp. NPDC058640 TaxID=3346571 RepID=UPI00364EAA19